MAMGKRKAYAEPPLFIVAADLQQSPAHPFYRKLNEILADAAFDPFVEGLCAKFYERTMGRPSLPPGMYFRCLLLGFFEGIDSERGVAWRCADSFSVRSFVGIEIHEAAPDHSTISRNRRLIDLETHQQVFEWVLKLLAKHELIDGKTVGIDATTLEANAAMRSIIRRDTTTVMETVLETTGNIAAVLDDPQSADAIDEEWMSEVVGDKGYHSNDTMQAMEEMNIRTYIPEPNRGPRDWDGKPEAKAAVYRNRRRTRGNRGKRLMRQRGELLERSFAHLYKTGGMRRLHLRHRDNIAKRLLIHAGGFNLSLVMRKLIGKGTPRGLQGLSARIFGLFSAAWNDLVFVWRALRSVGSCSLDLPGVSLVA
jgi:transposase